MSKITEKLYWKTWEGSLPSGAVNIWNNKCKRTDYVSKPSHRGDCGFYTQSKGPYCYYPLGGDELKDSSFEILVNEDDFEDLVWIRDSNGHVPKNAVSSGYGIFVGKNHYGLGKVHSEHHSLFIPWNGSEKWFHTYEVLTYNTDVKSETLSDVHYEIDKADVKELPPDRMKKSKITNKNNTEMKYSSTLEETVVNESKWDFSYSNSLHGEVSISSGIPSVADMGITVGAEETFTYSKGGCRREGKKWSDTLSINVQPKKTVDISIVVNKCNLSIPFTGRLTRTYNTGKVRSTNIRGTYKGTCVSQVHVEVKED